MISEFNKSNRLGDNINKKVFILKELRTLKEQIIFNKKKTLTKILSK